MEARTNESIRAGDRVRVMQYGDNFYMGIGFVKERLPFTVIIWTFDTDGSYVLREVDWSSCTLQQDGITFSDKNDKTMTVIA